MIKFPSNAVLLPFLALIACGPRGGPPTVAAERAEVQRTLEAFTEYWLEPAGVAPPVIDFEAQTTHLDGLTLEVRPVRAEDGAWNQWRDTSLRLFNNRAAYLFEVRVTGEGTLQWMPERSGLELNEPGAPLRAAESPEELLQPLLAAALDQERYVIDGDLVERTRAAGPFRALYMPVSPRNDELAGLIAFPLDEGDRHVVGLKVTVGVDSPVGPRQLSVTYD